MAKQFLLLAVCAVLLGCRQPTWFAARQARAAADALEDQTVELSGREAKVLSSGNKSSFDYAVLSWKAFVLTDPPVSGLVDSSESVTWLLAQDPQNPTTVELAAAESDESAKTLLRKLRSELSGLRWAPLKSACYQGGAFQDFGQGRHGCLKGEAVDTSPLEGLPIVVARFWLAHPATD